MKRLEPVLGWLAFLGLCLFWWTAGEPETPGQWFGVALRVVISFGILVALYEAIGYRFRGALHPELRPESLKEMARHRLSLLQSALEKGDFLGLQETFTTEALNHLATLSPETAEALRGAWFGKGSMAEIGTGVYAATVTVTSAARRLGEPVVKAELKLGLDGRFPVLEVKVSLTKAEERKHEGQHTPVVIPPSVDTPNPGTPTRVQVPEGSHAEGQ